MKSLYPDNPTPNSVVARRASAIINEHFSGKKLDGLNDEAKVRLLQSIKAYLAFPDEFVGWVPWRIKNRTKRLIYRMHELVCVAKYQMKWMDVKEKVNWCVWEWCCNRISTLFHLVGWTFRPIVILLQPPFKRMENRTLDYLRS